MSFRELRNFTEVMRALGYPRLISIENFRIPNFELVADCLYWLVQRYDPGTDVSDEISTEQERIEFLQSIAQTMLTKSRMKLNIKRLYAADGHAVKELLKIAALLHKATQKATTQEEEVDGGSDLASSFHALDGKAIRDLSSSITQSGAALHDALGKEPELREARLRSATAHTDTDTVERTVREAIEEVQENVRSHANMIQELKKTTKTLDGKLDKKKTELERSEKRLSTLQSVRPAYMDEYEKLEAELQSLYDQYLERCRNLQFLESELEQYYFVEREEKEASEKKLKKMQNKMREEELRILRGEQEVDENKLLDSGPSSDDESSSGEEVQRIEIEPSKAPESRDVKVVDGRQVLGDITGGAEDGSDFDDDASIEDDSGSESEVSIMDNDDSVIMGDEDDFSDIHDDDDDGDDFSDDNF